MQPLSLLYLKFLIMEKLLTKLVQAERHAIRANEIYRILGHYGDRLPENVQVELRIEAEKNTKDFDKKFKSALK